jgi:hypothetical protein
VIPHPVFTACVFGVPIVSLAITWFGVQRFMKQSFHRLYEDLDVISQTIPAMTAEIDELKTTLKVIEAARTDASIALAD